MIAALQQIISSIPNVKNERNYWLVRTNGGEYFDEFRRNKLIGIGWNLIVLEDVYKICDDAEDRKKSLTELIRKNDENDTIPGYSASQIIRFVYEMRKDDIVIIPSESSNLLLIGRIVDDRVYTNKDLRNNYEITLDLKKFRKVSWLKTTFKNIIDPELYKILFSHHAVSQINEYSIFIDRILNSIYQKNGEYHFIVDIGSNNNVSGRNLFRTWLDIFDLVDEFSREKKINFDTDNIETKLKVQSPGIIEFIAAHPESLIVIGIILIVIVGGGLEFTNEKFPFKLKTDGLIREVSNFLNQRSRRKIVEKVYENSMKELKIENPSQLLELLEGKKDENKSVGH